ncbi:MAG: hypothetical protein LBU22_04980 [Dysgonamonadaceae bacterium]|jgi:hypothetical protein|nr:hypothetical protein [Dysgonamonadaceae bacterium]
MQLSAIIINTGNGGAVGAHLCVRPNDGYPENNTRVHPNDSHPDNPIIVEREPILGEHTGSPLHAVVQWFKTMSTNEYIRGVKTLGWSPFNKKLWQRNYYDHIIRNDQSYQNISDYISNNPMKWMDDKFFVK